MARHSAKAGVKFHSVRQFREYYFPKAEAERARREATANGEVQASELVEETAARIREHLSRARVQRRSA
jgi:hypothetical protein